MEGDGQDHDTATAGPPAWQRTSAWTLGLRVFAAVIAVDAAFVVLHVGRVRYDSPAGDRWLLSYDRGWSEIFQYSKLVFLVALCASLAARRRQMLYGASAVLFAYLAFDDAFQLHERLGDRLAPAVEWADVGGVEARDIGQILVSLSAAVVLLAGIAVAHARSDAIARTLTAPLLAALVMLAVFGIVVDVIDVLDIGGIVEDGGELVAVTFALAVCVHHRRTSDVDESRGTVRRAIGR